MKRRGCGLRSLAVAVVVAAACLALPALAAAHAELDSTDPAAGAALARSPAAVTLTFSEAADPRLSLIKIADQNGAFVPGVSGVSIPPGSDAKLQVKLSHTLPKGTYTVNWLAVSTDDGHVGTGAFIFGVGQKPVPAAEAVVPLSHTSTFTVIAGPVGRWLLYAALILMVGAASTSLAVYRGVLPAGGLRILWVAVVTAVVALGLLVWVEKVLVGARTLLPLFQTKEGKMLLALAVAIALCAGAVALVDLWPARWSLWLLGAAGAAAVLVHVASGHAASQSSIWVLSIPVQWVHMTAVGVWVGGLFWLLMGFRGREHDERTAAVRIFTRIATWTLVVVLATGLTRALAEVRSPAALFDTSYGITLVVKVVLVAGLAGLGALNHFFWVPALSAQDGATAGPADGDSGPRRFGLNSRAELAVALAVLAATAVLTGLAPARTAAAVKTRAAAAAPAVSAKAALQRLVSAEELTRLTSAADPRALRPSSDRPR